MACEGEESVHCAPNKTGSTNARLQENTGHSVDTFFQCFLINVGKCSKNRAGCLARSSVVVRPVIANDGQHCRADRFLPRSLLCLLINSNKEFVVRHVCDGRRLLPLPA